MLQIKEVVHGNTCHRCAGMYKDPDEIHYSKKVVWVLSLHAPISVYHYCTNHNVSVPLLRVPECIEHCLVQYPIAFLHLAILFFALRRQDKPFLMTAPAEWPSLHTTNDNYRGTSESVRETHWPNYPELTLPQRRTITAYTSKTECVQ